MTPRSLSLSSRATRRKRDPDAATALSQRQSAPITRRRCSHDCWLLLCGGDDHGIFCPLEKWLFVPFRFMCLSPGQMPGRLVIAIDLVARLSRRAKLIAAMVYFLIGGIVGAISGSKAQTLSIGQLLYLWLDFNAPPTVLACDLSQSPHRALGPMVLVFMILSVTGATLSLPLIGHNLKLLKAVSDFSHSIGLTATGTTTVLHLIGFARLRRRRMDHSRERCAGYYQKNTSASNRSPSTPCGCFSASSIPSAWSSEGRFWIFSGIAAFVLYKLVVAVGLFHAFRNGAAREARVARRLLLLRGFALGRRRREPLRLPRQIPARGRRHADDRRADLATSTIEAP